MISSTNVVILTSMVLIGFMIAISIIRRNQRCYQLLLATLTSIDSSCRTIPSSHLLSRTWLFDSVFNDEFPDLEFLRHFRMRRQTFDELCDTLQLDDTTDRVNGLTPQHQLAIVLYRFGSGLTCRTTGALLGVADSTVVKYSQCIVHRLLELKDQFIIWPTTDQQRTRNAYDFAAYEGDHGLTHCIGAIDGTHIPVTLTWDGNKRQYCNRKKFTSIVLQAIVNYSGQFIHVTTGWPGGANDARVFNESDIDETAVPPPFYLIGDGGYPLRTWIITPFRGPPGPDTIAGRFNRHLSSRRVVVEQAFGKLKGRWRLMTNCNAIHHETACNEIIACTILHNFCETHNDKWDEEEDEANILADMNIELAADDPAHDAEQLRLAIAQSLP